MDQTSPNDAPLLRKPVTNCAKPWQNFDLQKKCVIAFRAATDSIKMERVGASTIGNTLAQKSRLVPGVLKMVH